MLAALLLLTAVDASPTLTLWHAWRGKERQALEDTLEELAPEVRAVPAVRMCPVDCMR